MPKIDYKIKVAIINLATNLLKAQANKFQSMLLKLKDEYLLKLQEEGLTQIQEKGPNLVCPIIIPEIEKILPKLNSFRSTISNMDKLTGILDNLSTKLGEPVNKINTAVTALELIPAPIPPGLPINVILLIGKAINTLNQILDGLETGSTSLSTTSNIMKGYVQQLDSLLLLIENLLLEIINLCSGNLNAEEEAALVASIKASLSFDPENANTTPEEDIAVEDDLEKQLRNGNLVYQGFKLSLEDDPTPTTLLPSKRIVATGLPNTQVQVIVEGGSSLVPISGLKLYYPTPLPLTEEQIQELQSQGTFYDSSYTYSSNNKTLITLIKNKIDNYLNGKTEDFVKYNTQFDIKVPNFLEIIEDNIELLNSGIGGNNTSAILEARNNLFNVKNTIPENYFTVTITEVNGKTYNISKNSTLKLKPGDYFISYNVDVNFKDSFEQYNPYLKLSEPKMIITKGNVIKIGGSIKIIESTSIAFEITVSGSAVGGSYYNSPDFPLYPFYEEGTPGLVRFWLPDPSKPDYIKTYKYDSNNKRWLLLDLSPFGEIGVKDQIRKSGSQFYKFTGTDVENPKWEIQSIQIMRDQFHPFSKDAALWNNGNGDAIGDKNKKRQGIVYIKLNVSISPFFPTIINKGNVYNWDDTYFKWVAVEDITSLSNSDLAKQDISSYINSFENDKLEGPIKEFEVSTSLLQIALNPTQVIDQLVPIRDFLKK